MDILVRVADASALQEGGRLHLKLQDRYITLLRRAGKLYGIDSVCFHAGGPLGVGDIEEVNGNPCLVCPWHYYKVDMATGDKYYQQVRFESGKMVPGGWASNGVKQRAHAVTEQDGGLYVQLSVHPPKLDSDQYANNEACGERVMSSGSRAVQQGPAPPCFHAGADGKQAPSGAIMKAARLAAQKAKQSPLHSSSSSSSSSRLQPQHYNEVVLQSQQGLAVVCEGPGEPACGPEEEGESASAPGEG